jgi:hypothetical protein
MKKAIVLSLLTVFGVFGCTEPGLDAEVMDSLNLGDSAGLKAQYFNNKDFTDPVLERVDALIDFDWKRGSPDPLIEPDTFSARWTGFVKAEYSETYTFHTLSDDGIRLYVNNELIVNDWSNHAPRESSGSIALKAGQSYPIILEYFENSGGAVAKLLWSSPSQAKQIIPATQFRTQLADDIDDENIALGKPTSQSSTAYAGDSARAVDGNTSGRYGDKSVTHTAHEASPWWRVDLGGLFSVSSVTIYNRTDCCSARLSDFRVEYLDAGGKVLATRTHVGQAPIETKMVLAAQGVHAVRVQLNGTNPLSLAEVQVFGVPGGEQGDTRPCVEAAENKDASLSCPSGTQIKSIDFASYGLPTGSCESGFQVGACHASSSQAKVEAACLEQSACTIKASNAIFGDPCPGKAKRLAIVYTCEAEESGQNIVQQTQEVELNRPIAPTQRWTYRTSGRCGLSCRNGPRHMYSASFQDTFLMSWMAVDETLPQQSGLGWVNYGNVSTFSVSEKGAFTHVSDANFQGMCEAIYGITTNADGSIIALLCKGYPGAPLLPGTENLLGTLGTPDCDINTNPGCYPIGTYSPQGSPLYIFEYLKKQGTNSPAQVSSIPDRIILINHAVGGDNIGHHELALNQAQDTYFVALKVTNNKGDHQGLKHFGVRRTPKLEYVRLTGYNGWACGGGHVLANRMAYNKARDYWSLLCTNDLCAESKQYISWRCHNVAWSTVPGMSYQGNAGAPAYHEGEELVSFETTSIIPWEAPGGAAAIVSLGKDGWLALAPQPSPKSSDWEQLNRARSVGLINLPVEATDLFQRRIPTQVPIYGTQITAFENRNNAVVTGQATVNRYEWNRVFDYDPKVDAAQNARFGSTNLSYFSTQGEDSERLLLGWSPNIEFQGITSDFVVSEVDRQGRLRGEPLVLEGAGWGEDNRWITMPNSGCVVFPFAWKGDNGPGDAYPIHDVDISLYPTTIHLTSLCPGTKQQPPVAAAPSPWGAAK